MTNPTPTLTCTDSFGTKFVFVDYFLDAESKVVHFLLDDDSHMCIHFALNSDATSVTDIESAYAITEGVEYMVEVSDLTDMPEEKRKALLTHFSLPYIPS